MNSAEGGAITTNDGELADRLRFMRAFGFTAYDTVSDIGTNAKMNELSAAMGLTSLDAMSEFVTANERNYDRYRKALATNDIRFVEYDDNERQNRQYAVIELVGPDPRPWRDDLVAALHTRRTSWLDGTSTRGAIGSRRTPPTALSLPVTEDLSERVITLPTGASVIDADIDAIASVINVANANRAELHERVANPA